LDYKFLVLAAVILTAVFLIASGWTDSDWQLVSYRYSEWHRTVDYWEFNPFLKVNWWVAWQLSLARLVVGSLLLGFALNELRWRVQVE